VTDPPEYEALARNAMERRKAYLHFFARGLSAELRTKRADLVEQPFIGDYDWVSARRLELGATLKPFAPS
jgi:hypothetical protein